MRWVIKELKEIREFQQGILDNDSTSGQEMQLRLNMIKDLDNAIKLLEFHAVSSVETLRIIDKKAEEYADKYNPNWSKYSLNHTILSSGFIDGYKKALKDLTEEYKCTT